MCDKMPLWECVTYLLFCQWLCTLHFIIIPFAGSLGSLSSSGAPSLSSAASDQLNVTTWQVTLLTSPEFVSVPRLPTMPLMHSWLFSWSFIRHELKRNRRVLSMLFWIACATGPEMH